jgi:hypothetical protein
MRTLLISTLVAVGVYAADSNVSHYPYEGIWGLTNQMPLVEASKAASITNGITFGQVVTNIGPGWMSAAASVAIVQWRFADGRTLNACPSSINPVARAGVTGSRPLSAWPAPKPSQVLTLKTNRDSAYKFWFTPN